MSLSRPLVSTCLASRLHLHVGGGAQRGLQAALIEVGVPVDEAVTFSPHSFKHLLVTAGRQLQVPEPLIDVMAGWTVKASSGKPAVYDSVAASSELLYKDFIHRNVQQGWSLSKEGAIPLRPVVSFESCKEPAPVEEKTEWAFAEASVTQRGAALQLQRMSDSPLNETVIQVLNTGSGLVHLFMTGKFKWKDPKSLCGRWACGSPDRPMKAASFAASSSEWTGSTCLYGFCESCYGDCYPVERCLPSPKKAKSAESGNQSDSSTSSSSTTSDAEE